MQIVKRTRLIPEGDNPPVEYERTDDLPLARAPLGSEELEVYGDVTQVPQAVVLLDNGAVRVRFSLYEADGHTQAELTGNGYAAA